MILSSIVLAAVPALSLAEVPPEAQPAFNKGIFAAQQQDWRLAALSFQEARRSAPNSPELLYNLGLAESKMPGRELRAIAWLAAYLAANPKAANAPAVNALIDQLQLKSESNVIRLITTMQNAAAQLPSTEGHAIYLRDDALETVSHRWEDIGDFDAAQSTIDLIAPVDCCTVKRLAEQDLTRSRADTVDFTKPELDGKPSSMCDWAVMVDGEPHDKGQWCWSQRNFNGSGLGLGALNAPVFLDLAGYMSAPPPSGDYGAGDPREPIAALSHAASALIRADREISKMVRRQRTAASQPEKTR